MKKISVITICYNAETVIEKTLRSVLEQAFLDLEYIIIDGKSKDNTVKLINLTIRDYPNRDIKFVSEPDKGIYDAMNKGIRMASGEWVNCMNAGDVFHNSNVLSNIFVKSIPDHITVLYSNHITELVTGGKLLCNNNLNRHVDSFNHQSIIYKRKLHEQYGYYIHNKKLIISDTLFFAPIPDEEKMKVDIIISNYADGGASSKVGFSIMKQNLCAEYIFKNVSFERLILKYYFRRFQLLIPASIRKIIRKLLNRGEYRK